MKQITSILIGAGLRGGYVYSQYALDHPDEFKVIAVAEPDQERRELFAAKHNIPKELQYESYEELLQQDKMADCAMICTQDKMHYEPVTMAMQKGYHVLCEKPMSPDKEEIIKMGAMAKKYDRILSVCHVLRYSPFFSKIKEILEEDGIKIRGVYERSDANERTKEGLSKVKGFIGDAFDTNVEIVENGVHYMVDVANGQKTGFFLDQKYNRLAMQRICKGKKVLDCFTHMGTFALNAGIAGAADVTGLDISEYAVSQAEANARLNHLENTVHFRQANVLDELPKLAQAGEKYDVVILDPPAFTKSREATKNAIKGYREINMKGLKLVKDGGYLATCSCSHFMTQELLAKTVKEAAKATHKRLRQVEFRTQAPDHPILWAADESYYLKFYIFQVVDEK